MQVHYWELSNYNNGTLIGKWFDLEGKTKEEHQEDIQEWLEEVTEETGELCEEIILGDVEDVPSQYHWEYGLKDELFEFIEFMNNTHMDEEAVLAMLEYGFELENIEDNYQGEYDSDEDFAESFYEDTGALVGVPDHIKYHIDWSSVARELLMTDYGTSSGHYFRTSY